MNKKTKQYCQIFDDGIRSGIIAEIGEKVLALLATLACFMDKDGKCYPKETTLANILGKSKKTVSGWVALAKKTKYLNEPVITAVQNKKIEGGKWIFSSNHYTISKSIRDNLISRYYSVGGNPPPENNEVNHGKRYFPQAGFSPPKKPTTNDNPSVNNINTNDMRKSLINKSSFKGITLSEFEEMADTSDKGHCLDIAKWLGESSMNFILSNLSDPKCGMRGIEWAYGVTKECVQRGVARDRGKLFNFYVWKYKQAK